MHLEEALKTDAYENTKEGKSSEAGGYLFLLFPGADDEAAGACRG